MQKIHIKRSGLFADHILYEDDTFYIYIIGIQYNHHTHKNNLSYFQ